MQDIKSAKTDRMKSNEPYKLHLSTGIEITTLESKHLSNKEQDVSNSNVDSSELSMKLTPAQSDSQAKSNGDVEISAQKPAVNTDENVVKTTEARSTEVSFPQSEATGAEVLTETNKEREIITDGNIQNSTEDVGVSSFEDENEDEATNVDKSEDKEVINDRNIENTTPLENKNVEEATGEVFTDRNEDKALNDIQKELNGSDESTLNAPEGSNVDDDDSSDKSEIFSEKNVPLLDNEESNESDIAVASKKVNNRKKFMALIDSDSEDEVFKPEEQQEKTNASEKAIKRKNLILQDSEDEDTEIVISRNQNKENIAEDNHYQMQRSRLMELCDPESEDESEYYMHEEQVIPEKARRKRRNEEQNKKMTRKDAVEERRKIKSESQRMMRESHVSLPYHRPKSHTLDEFLKRRPRLSDVIKAPSHTPASFVLKMSSEQIALAAKRLAEREKEIEKFYKSDSESEEEHMEDQVIPDDNKNTDENPVSKVDAQTDEVHETENDNKEEKSHNSNESEEAEPSDPTPEEETNTLNNPTEAGTSGNDNTVTHQETEDENCNYSSEQHVTEDVQETAENIDPQDPNEDFEKRVDPEPANCITECEKMDVEEGIENNTNDKNESVEENVQEVMEISVRDKNDCNSTSAPTAQSKINLEEKLKKLNAVLILKNNFQPRLKGDPNDVVILDDHTLRKSKEVDNMIKRFLVHTSKKVPHKKHDTSILNVDNGALNKEVIDLNHDNEEEPVVVMQKPGAKLKKLREELEEQIAKKRLEEWKKRQEEKEIQKKENEVYEGEKTDCGLESGILDNEEEEELTESESSDSEEEEEALRPEKPRMKSAFVDDEAEESDIEDDEEEAGALVEDDADNEDEEESDKDENINDESEHTPRGTEKKKALRRVIVPDSDDSDNENEESTRNVNIANDANVLEDEKKKFDMWGDNDDDIPAYQPQKDCLEKTPSRPDAENKGDFEFLTPTMQLSALQGMNTENKLLQESPKIPLPEEPSPLKSVVTKLFTDLNVNSECYLDELEGLCSGTFTNPTKTQTSKLVSENSADIYTDKSIDGTDFASQPESEITIESDLTQRETITREELDEKTTNEPETTSNVENTDIYINKKKVSTGYKFVIMSSDEESQAVSETKKNKKKRKRFVIDDVSFSEDDSNDLQDEASDENEDDNNLDTNQNVNYDSEENEIEMDDENEIEIDEEERVVTKAREFFENEAELSESDWDSADEDEKGLDELEMEDGDAEIFNEKKIQRELGRVHMRQLLDEDKREVRMLQELLLEDGELHGEGRQRKFKWKNADSFSWNDTDTPKEDEEEAEDIESELQWRKLRHEREVFLEEQRKKSRANGEDDLISLDNKLLKLGEAALRRSLSSTDSQEKIPATQTQVLPSSSSLKLPFALHNQRGSFLARSERTLTRLAEMTKIPSSKLNNGPKNSKNFVFSTVTKTETVQVELERKRKASDTTPKVLKKLRIADMSPNVPAGKKSNRSLFTPF